MSVEQPRILQISFIDKIEILYNRVNGLFLLEIEHSHQAELSNFLNIAGVTLRSVEQNHNVACLFFFSVYTYIFRRLSELGTLINSIIPISTVRPDQDSDSTPMLLILRLFTQSIYFRHSHIIIAIIIILPHDIELIYHY